MRLLLLALVMTLGGQQIWAEVIRGQYQSCNYVIDTETGKMTVSGSGKVMYNFSRNDGEQYKSIVKELVVEEGVTGIDVWSFSGFGELISVKLPNTLTTIDQQAFSYCEKLTMINIPKGVTAIGGGAFYGCRALSAINLPEGLTEIGSAAFFGNTQLKEIIIPSTVKRLKTNAFMASGISLIMAYPSLLSTNAGDAEFYSSLPSKGGKICIINGTGSIPTTVTSTLPSSWTIENAPVLTGSAGPQATYWLCPTAGLLTISGTG